ncbi:ABC transporter permease [Falsochrobactrum ovis]|uniref:Lipopolysaccharide transport system permease protein n=1 Tax=Falsochrobactrum ovis TaxID=1293442 RepID=A0A364JXL1_9HYPH|nr:ABC transporter permease [Falsochrobactrum ovis]RAK32196.1 lipopolysaccharide transport system permease protein [Falsochrobactrum ovis]
MSVQLQHDAQGEASVVSHPNSGPRAALRDVSEALVKYRLALVFGWQDVAQRYRRSRVGAFWLTLNMAVLIGALGMIFGTLFGADMRVFLPYLCAGMVTWGFISTSLSDGCTAFSASDGIILQVRMPLFTHILRALWRNVIIFGHNILIFPVVMLFMGQGFNLNVLWSIPGFLLISLNLAWMMLTLAILCARFRDMTQVITNILQVLFYATPIMWMVKTLPEHVSRVFIDLNPFYHFIQLVRAPLFGEMPEAVNWIYLLVLAVIGWTFTILFFGRYRWRVAYWL